MRGSAEDGLSESRKVDLLTEMHSVALEKLVGIHAIRQLIISCEISAVKSKEQISHPSMLALSKDVKNRVQQKLSKVVDASRDEGSNTEVSLGGAVRMTEEFDKGISKLVPEFALPIILEVENEGLKLLGSFIALLGKEVWDVDVAHSGGISTEASLLVLGQ
ncbi:hypothetical protein HG530_015496 [Fusarium avenaceum]|nr:hypothetical protein HG530_015496 [Fusarium avenaceum]